MARCSLCGDDAATHNADGSCRVVHDAGAARSRRWIKWLVALPLCGLGAAALRIAAPDAFDSWGRLVLGVLILIVALY